MEIVAIIGILAMVFVGYLVFAHFKPVIMAYLGRIPIPNGSFGWPVIGETLAFLQPHPSTTLGWFLNDHCLRYGKVFKSHLFLEPTVVSCDPDLNCFILQNEGTLFEVSYPRPIHGILGELSMLVAVGDTHKRLRGAALSLVSITKSRPQFLHDVEGAALQILDTWTENSRVFFWEEARKFTFNVIIKQVLGLNPDDPVAQVILRDFLTFMKGLVSLPVYVPGSPYTKAVQARLRISSRLKAIMDERRQSRDHAPDDFLQVLMGMESLSEEEKLSFVLDSLLGGYETASLLLSMTVYFLGRCRPALLDMMMEHQDVRNRKPRGHPLNWEDYKRMEFTQKVINEAMRCGNIVKFVHRKAVRDVRFKDYFIPRGWKVLPVLSAPNLDPSIHADAPHFNPWRWENNEQVNRKFMPFGGGPRFCPGYDLAKVEVAFFLHHLLLNYSWVMEDEQEQPMAYPYVEFHRGMAIRVVEKFIPVY
ncbi:hypothetical protein SAY87_014723 [Trapa incisa]|uniref:Cytochrome P450 724B1 n=1 Tax=Trapa incisa TaxID=236973 RepID=A0AAN7H322_9MYRT|nr:hypothetical protein SAY87_014723 [Trapa incisa]